uniref:Uncharacterized protein n=1 Tax=Strigamia maritima TaxID=126957 RepID=T1ITT4_STRMM
MRSMDGGIWWNEVFKPFYGPDYCQWTNMDLQRLHDGEFRGNSFRFQEGWVVPTRELLRRLSRLGLPIRTENDILVHLCKPVDAMSPGEFYLQVGHQLPGRLSLKFTRRHFDGTIKIHPTVLELEEERQIGANPSHYFDGLRETAYRNTPTDRILTTIILLDIQTGLAKRESCAKFLARLNDPSNFRTLMPSPVNFQEDECYRSLPCYQQNYSHRQKRSGSDGNIPQSRMRALSVPVEPVENDENLIAKSEQTRGRTATVPSVENVAERSLDWNVSCHPGEQRRENQWTDEKTSLNDEYTGVRESLEEKSQSPIGFYAEEMAHMRRKQVSPRDEYTGVRESLIEPTPIGIHAEEMTHIRRHQITQPRTTTSGDEYTGVTTAMTTLSVRQMPRKMSGEMPVVEEYTNTDYGVSARGPQSWESHQEPLRDASYLPVTVEQMNRMTGRKHSH